MKSRLDGVEHRHRAMGHAAIHSSCHSPALTVASKETLVEFTARLADEHEEASDHGLRRGTGQVFTPPAVTRFMAERLGAIGKTYRLLDPGAGTGSLAAAVCERVLRLKAPRCLTIDLYENDRTIIPYLRKAMDRCASSLHAAGHRLEFTLHAEDFVLLRGGPSLFDRESAGL